MKKMLVVMLTFFCLTTMVSAFHADPDPDMAERWANEARLIPAPARPVKSATPLATGDYYIPKGVHTLGFDSLNIAVDSINANGVTGTVNLILDADTLREPSFTFNALLSSADNVVIKPATGRTVCLIVTGGVSQGNGVQMIGFNTGYVTFDGSNNGTDSRDLTVTTEQVSPVVDVPFGLNLATADEVILMNLIIKNIVVGQTNFRYGAVTNDKDGVEGFRVQNCQIGTAARPVRRDGLAPWGSAGTLTTQFNFVNNEIYCGTRGVTTLYLTNSEISGNVINILPTTAGNANDYMHGIYITGAIGNTIIHDNVINCLEKSNRTAGYVMGIAFAGNAYSAADIISVVNNMINVGAAEEDRDIYGIGLRSTGNMGNLQVYHNTVKINEHVSTLISYGIGNRSNGTGPVNIDLKNNIITNGHTGNTGSTAIGIIPTTSVLVSDFNVLNADTFLVNYMGASYASLALWQTMGEDVHSVVKNVTTVSATDLHLTAPSNTDMNLAMAKIATVLTDIDGDARADAGYAYAGADEGTAYPVSIVGTHYIGAAGTAPGGADPDYATLKAACEALNHVTIIGDVTMLITSDLTEPKNVALAVNTGGNTITFKPMTGVAPTVTYTQIADAAGTSGAFVIGQMDTLNAPLVPTSNVVIDGSNNEGGNTRDLTFVSAHGKNAFPFRIKGDCDNITIKNCIINADTSAISYGIWINPVFTTPDNFTPDNFIVENCSISATYAVAGTPIHVSATGTLTAPMENLIVKDNNIIGRTRGVFLNGKTNVTTIEGNTFEINQTASGYQSSAVIGNAIWTTGTTYVLGNDFQINATANTTAANGIRTIAASGGGTFIIANNFFQGFAAPDNAGLAVEMIGIRCGSTVEAYHNTFVLNDIVAGTGSLYRAINVAAGSPIIKNNIFVVEEDNFSAYCIGGTPGVSDYNNFYLKGTTNAKVHPLYASLADWQAFGKDINSVSKAVEFVSANNLHLAGASLGDAALAGFPIASVSTDIDGDLRSSISPYMGADEGNVALPDRPEFVTLNLVESVDQASWNTVQGDLESGFQMVLDPVNEFQYMTLTNATTNVPFAPGLYGFKIASHPATGFFQYWATRGVVDTAEAGTWQAIAWKIINGLEPTFYIKVDGIGEPMLVDGLQYLIGQGEHYLRIEGNYLTGSYAYTGKVTSTAGAISLPMTVNITFSGLAPEVFFTQYIEGSSNNKAIEIFNGSGEKVDLSRFSIKQSYNGEGWGIRSGVADTRYVLPLYDSLAAGDVMVIYNSQANAAIVAVGDTGLVYNSTANGAIGSNVAAFTGDDALGLFFGELLVDVIGEPAIDPGTNWPVAGGMGATSEFSLVRKASVVKGNLDWTAAAGMDEESSEWVVLPVDDFRFLGSHPHNDLVGPKIVGVVTAGDSLVQVKFSEPVDPVMAINTSNYSIDGNVLNPISVELIGTRIVVLKYGPGHYLSPNYYYNLYVENVADSLGNVIAAGTSALVYNNVPGDLPIDVVSADFETGMGTWQIPTYSGSTSGILATSTFALSDSNVYFGTKSAKINLLDDPATANGWFVRVWNSGRPDVAFDSKVITYVKASNPNIQVRFVFRDDGTGGDNEYLASPWVDITACEGDWQVIEVDLAMTPLVSWAVAGDGAIGSTNVISIDCIQLQCPDNVNAVLYFDKLTERKNLAPVEVTLQVDMSVQILLGNFNYTSDVVDVAGTFNNWGGEVTLMDDTDADSIFTTSMLLYPTQSIEYKFRINSNWDTSEFPGGGPNRTFTVPDTNCVVYHWYNNVDESALGINEAAMLPKVFALHQNFPNPFNPVTTIKYDLPKDSRVKIVIYDIMGREVRTLVNDRQLAGYKTIQWNAMNNNGNQVSSGYYFCVMQTGDFHKTQKMILLK